MNRNRSLKILAFSLGFIVIGMLVFFLVYWNFIDSSDYPAEADILHVLYGAETKIEERQDGKSIYIVEQLSNLEKEQFNYAQQVQTEIVHQQRGWDKNPQKILALTKTGPPDCCSQTRSSVLGSAILREENGILKVLSYQKLMAPLSSFERVSEGSFVNIGPDKMGFKLQDQSTSKEGVQTRELIISQIDQELQVIAILETLVNNSLLCSIQTSDQPCWETKSSFEFVSGDHLEYYDILVITTGTKLRNGELVSVDETQTLHFVDGLYQPEKP
jgi:hypothetical protein